MTAPISSYAPSGVADAAPLSNAVVGGPMGKNEFLKLLVAQMTNQDPLNPLDGQEMASQLAQFSSVEQLMNIGAKLDAHAASNAAMLQVANNAAALQLVGRDVTVATDRITVGPNGTPSIAVDIPDAGGQLRLRITRSDGTVLRTEELGYAASGERTIDLADAVDGLAPGTYNIEVDCTTNGSATPLLARMTVRADGVRFGPEGTVVTSGSLSFPIGTIISVAAGS